MKTYIPIDLWRYLEDGRLVCYRCFRVLPGDLYCVQSADFFTPPISEQQRAFSRGQFYELLGEERPDERSECFASIEEAIEEHNRSFED